MGHFSSINADRNLVVPGLGTFHNYSVGSTAYTTGIDHHFLAEGAEKPVAGAVRFAAKVSDTGELVWEFVHASGPNARKRHWKDPVITEDTQTDFPATAVAEMRRITETLHERDQVSWFFHAHGAVDMELRERLNVEAKLEHSITTLTELLGNPAEPTKHFVPAAESETGKGFFRPATAAEKAKSRAMWTERCERSAAKLAEVKAEQGERVALLNRLRDALSNWSRRKSNGPVSVYAIYQAAIPAPVAELAA